MKIIVMSYYKVFSLNYQRKIKSLIIIFRIYYNMLHFSLRGMIQIPTLTTTIENAIKGIPYESCK